MGLFGDVDISEVPEDPFFVEDGTYLSILTEIKAVVRESNGQHGLAFKWVVTEDDSEFNGSQLQDWKNYYPDITEADLTKDIRTDMSRLKQRLTQIGVAEDDMNSFVEDAEQYIGTEAYVTVKNTPDKTDPSKKYRNITFIRLPEDDD